MLRGGLEGTNRWVKGRPGLHVCLCQNAEQAGNGVAGHEKPRPRIEMALVCSEEGGRECCCEHAPCQRLQAARPQAVHPRLQRRPPRRAPVRGDASNLM